MAAAMAVAMEAPSDDPPTMEQPMQPMPPPMPEFVEIFEQMQALHLKLWEAHHAMLGGEGPVPRSCSSRLISESSMAAMKNVATEPGAKAASETATMSHRLMQKAMRVSRSIGFDDVDSVDGLCLRPECDVTDERLKELKRMQRRVSTASGSTNARIKKTRQYLLNDCKEGMQRAWYVLSPDSRLRMGWDVLVMIMVLLEIVTSPISLYHLPDATRQAFNILLWIMTFFWTLDIPLSFFTAVYVNDTLRFRLADIRREYFRTWLLFDVFMLLPDVLVLVLDISDGATGVLRVVRARRILRLGRFFQILRIWKILRKVDSLRSKDLTSVGRDDLRKLIQPVLYIGLSLAAAVHVLGSLWFVAGDTEGGWVMEEALHELPVSRQYTRSVEWAISNLPPSSLKKVVQLQTPPERWLGICGTAVTLLCGSMFVSFVTNTMADIAKRRLRTREILGSVRKYCRTHGISSVHSMQIRSFVEREHRRNQLQSHAQQLKSLPDGMVKELYHEAHSPVLHHHAFFKEIGEGNGPMEMNLCNVAVSDIHVLARDIIFDVSSKPKGMYFMAQGAAVYFANKKKTVDEPSSSQGVGVLPRLFSKKGQSTPASLHMLQTIIESNDYLAEPALWIQTWQHQGQLQSTFEGRAVLVSSEQLLKVLQDYANTWADAIVYARCFVKEMNRSMKGSEDVTDLPLTGPTVAPKTRLASGSMNFQRGQILPEPQVNPAVEDVYLP